MNHFELAAVNLTVLFKALHFSVVSVLLRHLSCSGHLPCCRGSRLGGGCGPDAEKESESSTEM